MVHIIYNYYIIQKIRGYILMFTRPAVPIELVGHIRQLQQNIALMFIKDRKSSGYGGSQGIL